MTFWASILPTMLGCLPGVALAYWVGLRRGRRQESNRASHFLSEGRSLHSGTRS